MMNIPTYADAPVLHMCARCTAIYEAPLRCNICPECANRVLMVMNRLPDTTTTPSKQKTRLVPFTYGYNWV